VFLIHGTTYRVTLEHIAAVRRISNQVDDHEMELVSENQPHVAVTVAPDGDDVRLLFDETAAVVEVHR